MSRARRTGALVSLAAGFFASALLRVGEVVAALPEGDGFGGPVAAQTEPDAGDGDLGTLLADLRERGARLAEREAALEDRAQTLEAVEARLREQLNALKDAQERLEQTAVIVDDAAERDVAHLSAMYAQMKPKDAAGIFDQMPPSFAAGFLGGMEPEQAALIMANMTAENAYAVSLLLAGRNLSREPGSAAATLR
ncbi:MAG: MotE family protein [Pikeienuella sp.]